MEIICSQSSKETEYEKETNKQIELKIGSFIMSKCEKELIHNEEYAEMLEDLNRAYLNNGIEQYKEIFNSIMELRKTVFYSTLAKHIHSLIEQLPL
jgi:hypothetical protein